MRNFYYACVTLIMACWLSGCAYTQRLTVNPLEPVPEHDKLPLRAALVLSDDACSYTYHVEQSRSLRTWVFQLGETLCRYAENLVRDSFTEVVVTASAGSALQEKPDIILTQRIIAVLVEFPDFPQSLWLDQEAEVILDWTVTDGLGKPLWSRTDGGMSQIRAGSFLTRARLNRKLMQEAVDEVVNKFRARIVSAPEIRLLAASKR